MVSKFSLEFLGKTGRSITKHNLHKGLTMLPGLAQTQPHQVPIQSAQPIQQAPQQQAQQPTQLGLAQAGQPIKNPQENMQAPQQQLKPFTGTVTFEGKSYEVKDGIINVEGHEFNVFQVGNTALDIVIAEGGQFVGIVQNGEFIQATAEMIDQLKQQGILQ